MRLFRKKDDVPKSSIWQRIKDAARTDFGVLLRGGVDEGSLEALETLLLEGDFGVTTSLALVA
ncbi:MAG: signal recognition particle-docking protein FtsY, partial [Gemmatimonadaceae bacterium]